MRNVKESEAEIAGAGRLAGEMSALIEGKFDAM